MDGMSKMCITARLELEGELQRDAHIVLVGVNVAQAMQMFLRVSQLHIYMYAFVDNARTHVEVWFFNAIDIFETLHTKYIRRPSVAWVFKGYKQQHYYYGRDIR